VAATVTEIGTSAVSANPAATVSVTTTAAVNVGEILFFIFAMLGNGTTAATATATAGGNAMTQDASRSAGTGTTNPQTFVFRYEPGSTLASGSTVTATVTNGGPGSVGKCIKVAGLVTGVGLDATAGVNSGLSQTPTTGATGTPPSADEVFALAAMAVNFNATGGTTAGNAYTALTDLSQTTRAVTLYSAWKDLTPAVAAQNESWTPTTWAANKSWAAAAGLYRVSAGAAAVPPVKPRVVLNAVNRSYQW
jgi:hypothetical protein